MSRHLKERNYTDEIPCKKRKKPFRHKNENKKPNTSKESPVQNTKKASQNSQKWTGPKESVAKANNVAGIIEEIEASVADDKVNHANSEVASTSHSNMTMNTYESRPDTSSVYGPKDSSYLNIQFDDDSELELYSAFSRAAFDIGNLFIKDLLTKESIESETAAMKKIKKTAAMKTSSYKCECFMCGCTFWNRHNRSKHFKDVHGTDCTLCGHKFNGYGDMKQHYTNAHKDVLCPRCLKSFCGLKCLRQHLLDCDINEHHLKPDSNSRIIEKFCFICDKSFLFTNLRQKHVEKVHGNECQFCGHVELQYADLLQHFIINHSCLANKCHRCSHLCPTATALMRHEVFCQTKKHFCKLCESFYNSSRSLRKHQKILH